MQSSQTLKDCSPLIDILVDVLIVLLKLQTEKYPLFPQEFFLGYQIHLIHSLSIFYQFQDLLTEIIYQKNFLLFLLLTHHPFLSDLYSLYQGLSLIAYFSEILLDLNSLYDFCASKIAKSNAIPLELKKFLLDGGSLIVLEPHITRIFYYPHL